MKIPNYADLGSKGFVGIPYRPDIREEVEKAMQRWIAFCALPEAVKKKMPYNGDSAGVGYELKEGKGNKADKKENFDFLRAHQFELEQAAMNSGKENIRPLFDVVDSSRKLDFLISQIIIDFAMNVEKEFNLSGFADEVKRGYKDGISFFYRYIHYFGIQSLDEEIASAHTDQSGFTLHLFESAPGLQCMGEDGKWIDMPVSKEETVIINSMQLQLRSGGTLKALPHRVVATPESIECDRYAMVVFVQLPDTAKYDKKAHGRLQEKEPGFNYHMSHAEFAQLFK